MMVNENERSTSIDEMVLVYSKYAISQSDSGPILAQTSDDFAGVISFIKYKVLFNIFVNKNVYRVRCRMPIRGVPESEFRRLEDARRKCRANKP